MFGSKEASEDKLKKMVEKGKWDKLRKQYLDSDKTTQVALAKACAASRNDGSVNQTELKAAITKALEKIVERA